MRNYPSRNGKEVAGFHSLTFDEGSVINFFSCQMKGLFRQCMLFWAENIIFVKLSFRARAYLHEIISLQPHEIHS